MIDKLSYVYIDAVVLRHPPDTVQAQVAGTDMKSSEQVEICPVSKVAIRLSKELELITARVKYDIVEDEVLYLCR